MPRARSTIPYPEPGWPSVEHSSVPPALLAASRFHAILARTRMPDTSAPDGQLATTPR